jgi:hypothetical protein
MLYTVLGRFGNKGDFIGHIGGDDFVFLTTPQRYNEICQNFILMFDKIIPFHYSAKDRQQGFIIAKDRARKMQNVSLMSVSVAVVNRTDSSEFKNLIEINERVVEIKGYLKSIPGSKFMVDRRNRKPGDSFGPQTYNKEAEAIMLNSYKPLGQILLEKNLISSEQLDEALKTHWKRGVILGEIFKELGLLTGKELMEVLDIQKDGSILKDT